MTTPAYPLGDTTPPPAPSPPRRRSPVPLFIAGALVLVAATAAGTWWLTRPAAKPEPASATAAPDSRLTTLPVIGTLQLDGGYSATGTAGEECWVGGGFSDIHKGAQVTVTDPAGKVVGVGTLSAGTMKGHGVGRSCLFNFAVGDVPTGLGFYGIEVAHRGVIRYAEADLMKGSAHLTLS